MRIVTTLSLCLLLAVSVSCSSDSKKSSDATGGEITPSEDVTTPGEDTSLPDIANDEQTPPEDTTIPEEDVPQTPEEVVEEDVPKGDVGFVDLVELCNIPDDCEDYIMLYGDPGEDGHLAAARFTPPEYPFLVDSLVYYLDHADYDDINCNSGLAHSVELYVGTDLAPAAEPVVLESFDIEENGDPELIDGEYRAIDLTLETAVELAEGEHIFVAVKMALSDPDGLCLYMCTAGTLPDRDYWSGAAAPPYAWETLESMEIPGNIEMQVYGSVSE